MGKIMSIMVKPVKKINIENRAHAVISREKPEPAPNYQSTAKQLDVARTVNPNFMEDHYKKNAGLDERLKKVYVRSHDAQMANIESSSEKALPLVRRSEEDFEYGFWQPLKASEGRCTLGTAMTFIADHMDDPIKHSEVEISKKYNLDSKDVSNMLKYFRVFKMVVPDGLPQLSYTELVPVGPALKKGK